MSGEGEISAADAPVDILVVPANEELVVARETVSVVERSRSLVGSTR